MVHLSKIILLFSLLSTAQIHAAPPLAEANQIIFDFRNVIFEAKKVEMLDKLRDLMWKNQTVATSEAVHSFLNNLVLQPNISPELRSAGLQAFSYAYNIKINAPADVETIAWDMIKNPQTGDKFINRALAAAAMSNQSKGRNRQSLESLLPTLTQLRARKSPAIDAGIDNFIHSYFQPYVRYTDPQGDHLRTSENLAPADRLTLLQAYNSRNGSIIDHGSMGPSYPRQVEHGRQYGDRINIELLNSATASAELKKESVRFLANSPNPDAIRELLDIAEANGPLKNAAIKAVGDAMGIYIKRTPVVRSYNDMTGSESRQMQIPADVVERSLALYDKLKAEGNPAAASMLAGLRNDELALEMAQVADKKEISDLIKKHATDLQILPKLQKFSNELSPDAGASKAAMLAVKIDPYHEATRSRVAQAVWLYNGSSYIDTLEAIQDTSDAYIRSLLTRSHPFTYHEQVSDKAVLALKRIRNQLGPDEFYRRATAIANPDQYRDATVQFGLLRFAQQQNELDLINDKARSEMEYFLQREIGKSPSSYGSYGHRDERVALLAQAAPSAQRTTAGTKNCRGGLQGTPALAVSE